jgi:uncharacterized protein (TIGR02421 family)
MQETIVKIEGSITDEFVLDIKHRLSENKRVRRTLPAQGRLHIDRNLPFLCVYRRPATGNDQGTSQLITGEASYLVASGAKKYREGIERLVKAIVESLSRGPGSFLIIEIWANKIPVPIIDPEKGRTAPSFRILVPSERIPDETVESIESALRRIVVSKNRGRVITEYSNRPWPGKFQAILKQNDVLKYNCYLIGLEISPIYRDPETFEPFPFVLRKIQRGLSTAIKKGAYEFSQKRTTLNPASYKSLGRRAVVKAVWEVDQKLAAISNEVDFLLLVTPVNIEQSYQKFRKNRFEKEPLFFYRPITFDPSVLKRSLYEIPFERIEDPTLSSVFHEKMVELERKFSMIRDRNTRNFFYGSIQLYGEIGNDLVNLARSILDRLPPHSREAVGSKKVNAAYFAERARKEIDLYREILPDIQSRVIIRDDITGLMVSRGNLHIGKRVRIPDSRVEALIQHEVGTHVLTYINGLSQPFKQLNCGLAGSDELQEGIAVLSEYLVNGLSAPRFRLLAGRVIASEMLTDGATFIESFRELYHRHGFSQRTAYIITSRVFRSGGFTKDAVYLRGLSRLVEYIRNGGDLETLLIGKISIDDISIINELQLRRVLNPVLLTPQYLKDSQSIARLSELRQGKLIFNLI